MTLWGQWAGEDWNGGSKQIRSSSTHPISPSPPGSQGQGLLPEMQEQSKEEEGKAGRTASIDHIHGRQSLRIADSAHSVNHCILLITTASAHIWNGAYAHVQTLFTQSADNTWCSFCPQAPLTVTPGPRTVVFMGIGFIEISLFLLVGKSPTGEGFCSLPFWKWEMSPSLPHTPYPPSE